MTDDNVVSNKGKWGLVIEVPKQDRFEIDVYGEKRGVYSIKATRGDDGLVHASCHLTGKGEPPVFNVAASSLPEHIRSTIRTEYATWVASLPREITFDAKPDGVDPS